MKRLSASELTSQTFHQVIEVLREGGILCMPTDTVYGLAVDSANEAAVANLFRLKGRPVTQPVIVLVDSVEMVRTVSETGAGEVFGELTDRFWPGPLTLVLPARSGVSPLLTAGTGTLAVRWPAFGLAERIIGALGRPITSTSANLSGSRLLESPDEIETMLNWVDLLLDLGPRASLQPSTLVDLTAEPPTLLREGPIRFGEISGFLSGRLARRSP